MSVCLCVGVGVCLCGCLCVSVGRNRGGAERPRTVGGTETQAADAKDETYIEPAGMQRAIPRLLQDWATLRKLSRRPGLTVTDLLRINLVDLTDLGQP